jgi:hypothetical protein
MSGGDGLLPLPAAVAAIAPFQENDLSAARARPTRVPRVLHQYWDRDPPPEVASLLAQNARRCAAWGVAHHLWTQDSAAAYLDRARPDLLPLFRAAPHPAMACDLFRLVLMAQEGGFYLDADMSLRRRAGRDLFDLPGDALLFKWNRPEKTNVLTWCMAFAPGAALCRRILDATADSLAAALGQGGQAALSRALAVTGPGLFTRALGTALAAAAKAGGGGAPGALPGLAILDARAAYARVQYGPDSLIPLALRPEPLAYKRTARHWAVAAKRAE